MSVIVSGLAIAALSAGIWVLDVAAKAPPLADLPEIQGGENSTVYAANGTRLGVISSSTIRNPSPIEKIPDLVQEATIAIEDASFYDHNGVDWSAVIRAAFENAEAGEVVQGGSTITQQLIKIQYTGQLDDRNFEAKIQEAKLAEELEERYSKAEILEQYLNAASYGTDAVGREAIGIEAAARQFFDKRLPDLELKEAALLAGLPQAPSDHSPIRSPKSAKERRNDVLDAMAREGYISQSEASKAKSEGLGLNLTSKFDKFKERYFFDYVTQELIQKYGRRKVEEGGLKVYTTIDLDKQKQAREAISSNLAGVGPSAAVVTTDVRNGNILAMVANAEYSDRQFNLAAQGQRQPGSSFKTMVLAAAVREGIDPDTTFYTSKSPITLDTPLVTGGWTVQTYDNSSRGNISLTSATLSSDNAVYAQLDLDVGPEAVREMAYDLGIQTELNAFPAEALGGLEYGVTPLEMSNAYGTLADGGTYHPATAIERVEFPDGKVEKFDDNPGREAMTDGEAAEVTNVLSQNVTSGTGRNAIIGCPQAGKTGTTDDFKDAWFVGYTPRLSTSVWVGYPDAAVEMRTEYNGGPVAGGSFPAQIWGDYMSQAKGGFCGDFGSPSEPFSPRPFFGEFSKSAYEIQQEDGFEDDETTEEDTTAPAEESAGAAGVPDGAVGDDPGAYAPDTQE